MALKTGEKADAPSAPPESTTVLELSLYKIYTWGGITYERGKPYRFKNSDAIRLLAERDLERPIWKVYNPPRAKRAERPEIVDATMVSAPVPVDDFGVPLMEPDDKAKKKRIDIGTDDEIADILNRDDGGDVTV